MAIEIVSFPIKNGGSFHSYVSHYQRVPLTIAIKWEYDDDPLELEVPYSQTNLFAGLYLAKYLESRWIKHKI